MYLAPPILSGGEAEAVQRALASGWIAPNGPEVDAFEAEFAAVVGSRYALATVSGTAALHLALRCVGVGMGDSVFVSTLTFVASVFPILYLGARPTFVDSEWRSWNMDPAHLETALRLRARRARLPAAVVVVHLYGQMADMAGILSVCRRYDVPVIEDAAEALGATHVGGIPGTLGRMGIYSFNGNKIITTSGGGMLVSNDESLMAHARKLANQAREDVPWYEHHELGYNYRMSNLLAAVGRVQLPSLPERAATKRHIFHRYRFHLGGLPGIDFQPEAPWGTSSRWLTAMTVDPAQFGRTAEEIRLALQAQNIESRRVWKPMHQQPVFAGCPHVGRKVANDLFDRGLCLPSGAQMTDSDVDRVSEVIWTLCSTAN